MQTVRAEDVGGKQGTATVKVTVIDINDSSPRFDGVPYSFRVREGESGADVGKVRAFDDDNGDNANVHYSVSEDSPFSIDAIDGRIRRVSSNAILIFAILREPHSPHYDTQNSRIDRPQD